ncbi:hypothetical protein BXZ70DRAFT_893661 [Cristinia sonorae]|uniref:AMP-dependent synthetase/ligase domain-containing protein n=1 Tax=Cristinia sonorae TaxID=1940300 RepID=A0A8K0UN35_9AGAR|nr:hypothetical protein BXZ70DRAFT_893661 [Cristinia sonorae]
MSDDNVKSPHNAKTLDAVLLARVAESPDHRFLFRPEHNDRETPVQSISYSIFDAHVSRLARLWVAHRLPGHDEPLIQPNSVVGVFFPSGYTICTVIFSVLRLGGTPFCLSVRNSDDALRHLVRTGNVVAIIASTEHGYAERIKAVINEQGGLDKTILELSTDVVADLTPLDAYKEGSYPALAAGIISGKSIAIQQHTSGSTAFPKPVPLSNEMLLRSLRGGTWWVEGFHTQDDIAVGQPPIFHMFGLVGGLLSSMYYGHTFAIPPIPIDDNNGLFPSSETLLSYAHRVGATEFFGVSSSVVGLARTDGGMDLFKSLKRVLVAGAPMPRENGDWIVSHGVHLVEGVGSTEGGSLLHSNRPVGDKGWQAMRVCWNITHHFQPFGPPEQKVYELVLHSSPQSGDFPGADPVTGHLSTHDLFREWPHPGANTWVHCGRSDDVLLLSSGQNWNPRPMELQIEASADVQLAVVFGHARPSLGVLIAPRGAYDTGDSPSTLTNDLKDAVWRAVEVANAIAPSNARIARERVLLVTAHGVLGLDGKMVFGETAGVKDGMAKKIPVADKGTPLRPKTYVLFADEIDTVYGGVV